MANNTTLNPGSLGDTIATEDIAGVKHELVKVEFGVDGVATKVSAANPLPVADPHATDGTQKGQIVDSLGNVVTVTGNKLDVNATFAGTVSENVAQLGGNNIDTNSGAKSPGTQRIVIATDQPQLTNAFKVDGSGVTQPVSAAALPLPTGASTETTLGTRLSESDFDTKTGSLTETAPATDTALSGLNGRLQRIAQRISSLITALGSPFQAGGSIGNTAFGVTGNVTVVQPTGTNLHTVVDSGSVTANAGTNLNTSLLALDSTVSKDSTVSTMSGKLPATLGAKTIANSMAVNIASDQTVPISGSVTITPSGTQDENIKQVNGVAVNVGIGTAGTGTQRVAVSSDSTIGLVAGSAIVGKVGIDQTTPGTTNKVAISDALGNATNSAGSGFLKTTDEPKQIFYDPFDAAPDTTNVWTLTSGNSGVIASVTTGVLSMGTGTVANGWSKAISIPTFKPVIPGWLVFSDAIALPDGAAPIANSYRFFGSGTTPATPSTATPVTDGYGFELNTDGKMRAVVYAGGTRTIIQDLSTSGNSKQPLDANNHRYIIQVRTDKTFFYIDTYDSAGLVATTSFQSPQIQTLPKLYLAIGAATPPVSNTQIQSTGAVVSDTGKNATQLADATYPWRKAAISAAGALSVTGTVSIGAVDNTQLYSNTISATGAITGIDTTGYQSIVAQISGSTWVGSMQFEGSNDNAIWQPLMAMAINDFSMTDYVTNNGVFQIKTSTKFIRLNVLSVQSGTITALILGRTTSGMSASDVLSYAMDFKNNAPLYIQETASKKDVTNALIPSDAPAPIYGQGNVVNAVVFQIDTTGYQSFVVQYLTGGTGNITVQSSNDGITWAALLGVGSTAANSLSTISTVGVWEFPVAGRFVRGIMASSFFASCLVYLRQRPVNPFNLSGGAGVNIQSIGGVAFNSTIGITTSAGAASTSGSVLPIGAGSSNNAPGSTIVPYPIILGGREAPSDGALGGKVRILLTDTLGKAIVTGDIPASESIQNIKSIPTQDQSQFEGQSQIEILGQILLELRIQNQYMYELPLTLQRLLNDTTKSVGTYGNEPSEMRNDVTLFAV